MCIRDRFASAAHGQPRTTQDIDIVIDPDDERQLQSFLAQLPTTEFYFDSEAAIDAYRRRSMFNLIHKQSGWKIDLILRKRREFSRAEFKRRVAHTLMGVPVLVSTPEDTVVAKLEWSLESGGSRKQRNDILGVLMAQASTLDMPYICLLYTSPSPRDRTRARMPSSA